MTVKTLAASSLGLLLLAGCATSLTPSESGTLTGAGLGAAGGAVLGGIAGSAGTTAAIGAGVGAVAGTLAGRAIEAEQATRAYPPWYAHAAAPNPSTPPPPPDAALEIEAMPEEAEIIVDGSRIGLAKEFQGPVIVPVEAGLHIVQFAWQGRSITKTIVASPWTTVFVKRDLRSPTSNAPQSPPPGLNPQPPN